MTPDTTQRLTVTALETDPASRNPICPLGHMPVVAVSKLNLVTIFDQRALGCEEKETTVIHPDRLLQTVEESALCYQPCGGQGLRAPAGCQTCASEQGEPSSGHWSTRVLRLHVISNGKSSPRDLHLNAKTQLHSMTSKLQCWTPYAKQLARQKHNTTH